MAGLIVGTNAPAAESESAFKLPEYEKSVLQNGLTVYLMEQHEVPLVYVSFVFPAGAVKDGNKYGLASLTAEGLLFGTKNYTKKQIEETLDFIGASFNTYAAKEYAGLSMSFVNTDRDQVFPIMKDLVLNPLFDADEFDKRKTRLLVELEQAKERPRSVIRYYYDNFLYRDHVYGNPIPGTIKSVTEISVKNLKDFYHSNYTPKGSALAIVGDFNIKNMKQEIQDLFKDWKVKETAAKIEDKPVPVLNKTRVLLINKEDATDTQFMVGGYGIKRGNPDYIAIQVINTILGGRFTSWLMDELRIKRGLTYGVSSFFRPYKNTGIFAVSSFTDTETTFEALDVTLEILNRLHEQGIDEATLNSAKNYIKGQYPPQYETSGDLANLLTEMYIYDFDESFINNFQDNVDKMTVEKSGQIISKYFPNDNLQLVLIGKASELRDSVAQYGEISEKEIKADGF
ncbi:insulinase family protein [candidate division KSB1 bacterium]|nr:insulinase family protein [candidate division KSB1 bacterium]